VPLRSAVAAVAVAALVATGCSTGSAPAAAPSSNATTSGTGTSDGSRPTDPSPTSRTRTRPPAPTAAELRARALRTVRDLAQDEPDGAVSVAAVNMRTGAKFAWGRHDGMWTASAYKLFLLVTLLMQRQSGGSTGLSDYEQDLATRAIENSDNAAGYSLFLDVGSQPAMAAAARRLGMGHTVPGYSDPTFTRTSAMDYVHLLRALVRPGPLNAASRGYVLSLMRNVEADQRWGVGAAADPGTRFANKNGWLSIDDSNAAGERDDGRWAVTSAGVVTVQHQQVLMAVFTEHQPDFRSGVRLVERLAKAIAPAVAH
jgi:beta-lactamase class A